MEFSIFTHDNAFEIVLRILVSFILGFLIGLEREINNKAAGIRTTGLVCVGSTIFTLISIYGFAPEFNPDGSMVPRDQARIAAQIVTGIGFIGGGVVFRSGVDVVGLTTAASIWVASSIGVAVGAGQYLLATFGTLVTLAILVLVRKIEKRFIRRFIKKYKKVQVSILCKISDVEKVKGTITDTFKHINEFYIHKSDEDEDLAEINFVAGVFAYNALQKVNKKLRKIGSVIEISLKNVEDSH